MRLLEEAVVFAVRAHSGMTRKGSDLPYILHPMETAAIVSGMTEDQEVMAAAVLHDVLEDTPATAEELRKNFGERVAELVCAESENKRTELPAEETWLLRKREAIGQLEAETDPAVKMIALADKLYNLRAMQRDQQTLGDRLWERFHQKDKQMHGWYYRKIADAVRELEEFPAWRELDSLIRSVFGGEL